LFPNDESEHVMPRLTASRTGVETVNSLKSRLLSLAGNLLWTWEPRIASLFASIDSALFEALHRNPVALLRHVADDRLDRLAHDAGFLARLSAAEKLLKDYLGHRQWFAKSHHGADARLRVAYFCAEFALHESLPIYSGGLGVLAGDHLKSASDLGIPLVAIGLLYRFGYYRQEINADGTTGIAYPRYDFEQLAIHDTGESISLPIGPRVVSAKIWRADVGRVPLYLLDTDHDGNRNADDRAITHHLYGGDSETRIRQEVLLGVGGMMALRAVGVTPTVLHLNEGHAAFAPLQKLLEQIDSGKTLAAAIEAVRAHGVFTTHTPVPAGHDRFDRKLARRYLDPLLHGGKLRFDELMKLGSEHPDDRKSPLCMTALALRLSRQVNGVAELHGKVSREMWRDIYDVPSSDEVPIGHVTNGVHSRTWLAPDADAFYSKYLKPDWLNSTPRSDCWKHVDRIPPTELWNLRTQLRRKLVRLVRNENVKRAVRLGLDSGAVAEAGNVLDENTLTIGFARRFATYKRAPLIFTDPKRLARIVGNDRHPVQFVFAGKAHPKDLGGQDYLRRVVEMSHDPRFKGRIVVLENYDMNIGRMLTSGCDIWLNNPLRPNEASGTSGMKPPLHGGVNLSILDGWWPEGFNGKNGFAIGDGRELNSPAKQDRYDANCIYELLESTIVPMFYERDKHGLPTRWLKIVAESMRSIPARFSTHRMLGDYLSGYYLPAHRG
jgi:starch phosphorylase